MNKTSYNEMTVAEFIKWDRFLKNKSLLMDLPQPDIDIGLFSFGQKLLLQKVVEKIKENENQYIADVVAIYEEDFDYKKIAEYKKSILNKKITDIYPKFAKLLREIDRILGMEKNNLQSPPASIEQKRAGVEKLNEFGDFATIYSLAKLLNKPIEDVEKTEYYIVYEVLRYEKELAAYREKYNLIMSKK
jgi:hypothetical protein